MLSSLRCRCLDDVPRIMFRRSFRDRRKQHGKAQAGNTYWRNRLYRLVLCLKYSGDRQFLWGSSRIRLSLQKAMGMKL